VFHDRQFASPPRLFSAVHSAGLACAEGAVAALAAANAFERSAPSSMYTAGTTNSVNIVPIERPAAITRPIWKRDTAPAPAAVISGATPSTMAAVVIRIG